MQPADSAEEPHRSAKPSQEGYFEIRIQGRLDSAWSDWFDGMVVTPLDNGETLIAGPLPDQAALQGILTKVFNLRLPLLSVIRIYRET